MRYRNVLSGLLLLANLFLSTYFNQVVDVVEVNHLFDLDPYSVKAYWFMLHLHFTPLVYLLVFALIKPDYPVLKWVLVLVEFFRLTDFIIAYNDYLLDADVVGVFLSIYIVFDIVKELIKID